VLVWAWLFPRGGGVRGFGVCTVLDFRCLYGFDCYNSVTILLQLTVDYLAHLDEIHSVR